MFCPALSGIGLRRGLVRQGDGHGGVFAYGAFYGNAVCLSEIVLDPAVYIADAHMAEEIIRRGAFPFQNLPDPLRAHAYAVIRDGDGKQPVSLPIRFRFRPDGNLPDAAFWLDPVEHGVFDNRLQGEPVEQAAVKIFGTNLVVDLDIAAVPVLLDQEEVFYQRQLIL